MAIYWYDFNAATEGVGTYASPYNCTTNLVASLLASGDEIRIKGISLTSITDSTFTADFDFGVDKYRLTNCSSTAGVSAYDVIIDDVTRVAHKVATVASGTELTFYAQAGTPSTEYSFTGRTFRVIKPASMIQHSSNMYLGWLADLSNITISDGWDSETTRVTDQSYISLLTGSVDTSVQLYFYGGPSVGNRTGTNNVVNLQNTLVCGSGPSATGYSRIIFYETTGVSFYLHAGSGNTTTGPISWSSSTGFNINSTFEFNHLIAYYGLFSTSLAYGRNTTYKANNLVVASTWYLDMQRSYNCTLHYKNVVSTYSLMYYQKDTLAPIKLKIIYDGDYRTTSTGDMSGPIPYLSTGSSVEFTSNFHYYKSGVTESTNVFALTSTGAYSYEMSGVIPKFTDLVVDNTLSGLTFNKTIYFYAGDPNMTFKRAGQRGVNTQHHGTIVYDSAEGYNINSINFMQGTRMLVKDLSGTETAEYLQSTNYWSNKLYAVKVTQDTITYKTVSPSYRFLLGSFNTTYNNEEVAKSVHIPVAGNGVTQFSVSGWIKADVNTLTSLTVSLSYDSTYTDVPINIVSAETDWTQFTINFTPATNQITELRIIPLYKAAGSFYLSDIGVA